MMMKMKWNITLAMMMLWGGSLEASAQFLPPACGGTIADSTCYTTNTTSPTACTPTLSPVGKMDSCPAPYSGQAAITGTNNSCTGTTTWNSALVGTACTACPNPLTTAENDAMLKSVVEVDEGINLALMHINSGCSNFSCADGTPIKNPLTGTEIGHYFRDHVWIFPDGFSSGLLPSTNRINYLLQQNLIPSNLPESPLLPKTPSGAPINNAGVLYLYALNSAQSSGVTSCSGNDADHCDINCSSPSNGWQQNFCAVKTVQYWGCSDSYAVAGSGPGGWQPTPNVQAPFLTSASSGSGDYTPTNWDWPTVFGWNGPSVDSRNGGDVYLCDSTINTCNGWVTKTWVYQCKTPATYDCSYTDSGGTVYDQTCSSCDPAAGAVWDYLLQQTNDCPMTPVSTRSSDSRTLWLQNLVATGCPVIAGPTGGGSPPPISCPSPAHTDPTGTACTCDLPLLWNGTTCVSPPPPVSPPSSFSSNPLSLSNGVPVSGGYLGSLNVSNAQITSVTLSGGSLPPGLSNASLGSSGNMVSLSGTATGSGTFTFNFTIQFAADPGGAYPAGSVSATATVTVTGCGSIAENWTSGSNSCAATENPSASSGLSNILASTNGTNGTLAMSCDVSTGLWAPGASTCGVGAFSLELDELVDSPAPATVLAVNPTLLNGHNASNVPSGYYLNMLNTTNQTGVNRYLRALPINPVGAVTYLWTITPTIDSNNQYTSTLSNGGPLGDWSGASLTSSGFPVSFPVPAGNGLDIGTRSPGDSGDYDREVIVSVTATDSVGHTATKSVTIHTVLGWEDTPLCVGHTNLGGCPPPP